MIPRMVRMLGVKTPAKVPRVPWDELRRVADMGSFLTGSVACGVVVCNAAPLTGEGPGPGSVELIHDPASLFMREPVPLTCGRAARDSGGEYLRMHPCHVVTQQTGAASSSSHVARGTITQAL